MKKFEAPYPYFGGKATIASEIWRRLGDPKTYIEPFMGSAACLLARPGWSEQSKWIEVCNDKDGYVSNFWRAVRKEPDVVAEHADWPLLENDFHSRRTWLVCEKESMQSKLEGDPDWYDAKAAGWWVWVASCCLGSVLSSGPWVRKKIDGQWQLVREKKSKGVCRSIPGNPCGVLRKGIARSMPLAGPEGETGVRRRSLLEDRPAILGVARSIPNIAGRGVHRYGISDDFQIHTRESLLQWMRDLALRFREVRVCCGDWKRVCSDLFTTSSGGITGILLDPPYAEGGKKSFDVYRMDDTVASKEAREWAIEMGKKKSMRIALCGYDGEHEMPPDWEVLKWRAQGGYGNQREDKTNDNRYKERVWFSPFCKKITKQEEFFQF